MQNSKVKAVDTYFTYANYWAPLTDNNDDKMDNDNIQKNKANLRLPHRKSIAPQLKHLTKMLFADGSINGVMLN